MGRNCALKMALNVAICALNAAICTDCLSGGEACAGGAAQAVGDSRRFFYVGTEVPTFLNTGQNCGRRLCGDATGQSPSGALSFGVLFPAFRFAACRAKYNRAVPTVGRPCLRQAGLAFGRRAPALVSLRPRAAAAFHREGRGTKLLPPTRCPVVALPDPNNANRGGGKPRGIRRLRGSPELHKTVTGRWGDFVWNRACSVA